MSDLIDRELKLAKQALQAREQALEPGRRARLWAAIDERTSTPPPFSVLSFLRFLPYALAGAAAVVLGALYFGPVADGPVSPMAVVSPVAPEPMLLAAEAELTLGTHRLLAKTETKLTPSSLSLIELEGGRIEVAVSPVTSAFALVTPEAKISTFGGRLSIERVAGRTRVELIEGTAVLETSEGTKTLAVGARVSIPSEEEVVQRPLPLRRKSLLTEKAPDQPKKAPEAPLSTAEGEALVAEARSWVERDAPRARAIVEDVLETKPTAKLRVDASMVLADALRLEGQRQRAAETYGFVAASPEARAFREEAMYRQAQLLGELNRRQEALGVLERASTTISRGLLLPERTVLAVDLLLAENRADDAAELLARTVAPKTRALERAQQRVREAQEADDEPGAAKKF